MRYHDPAAQYPAFVKGARNKHGTTNNTMLYLYIVHDFTLFVADIHEIMLISLFPTPFYHFHFHFGTQIKGYNTKLS